MSLRVLFVTVFIFDLLSDRHNDVDIADNDAEERKKENEEKKSKIVQAVDCLWVKSVKVEVWFSVYNRHFRHHLQFKFRGALVEFSVRMFQQPRR